MNKIIYWLPRILSILFILFLAMFSLDIFDGCNEVLDCALGLFMHNIPVLILLVLLIVSWKHELVGAVVFALGGILYILTLLLGSNFQWFMLSWSLTISGPAFVVAFLWYLNWKEKKKGKKKKSKK